MRESEREQVKHRAAFLNGVGLVLLGGLSIGGGVRLLDGTLAGLLNFFFVMLMGFLIAAHFHRMGQRALRRLDRDPYQ